MVTLDLTPDATFLSAFRALPDDTGRQYSTVGYHSGRPGILRDLRRFAKLGFIVPTADSPKPYAVLDVLDENRDIVQDFAVPDAQAWRYIKRLLRLTVEPSDN